jgi:hypothetical protein
MHFSLIIQFYLFNISDLPTIANPNAEIYIERQADFFKPHAMIQTMQFAPRFLIP